MWVYPTIQAINVGLSMHPSSTRPSGNESCTHPCLSIHVSKLGDDAYNTTHCFVRQSHCSGAGVWSDVFIFVPKETKEKRCFLAVLSERNFDFMVLIIFLHNHSRRKHKDAEIVPLSHAPQ